MSETIESERRGPLERIASLAVTERLGAQRTRIQTETRLLALERRLDTEMVTEQKVVVVVLATLGGITSVVGLILAIVASLK